MKTLLTLSLSLVLLGCTTSKAVYHEYEYKYIKWIQVDSPHQYCQDLGIDVLPGYWILGCAEWNDEICHIYTHKGSTDDTLGHELRHCFEGDFHPEDTPS